MSHQMETAIKSALDELEAHGYAGQPPEVLMLGGFHYLAEVMRDSHSFRLDGKRMGSVVALFGSAVGAGIMFALGAL